MLILNLKDREKTFLQTGLGKLFSDLSSLSFQLGNIRHIRKISFFHHAGGGRGHNGELCNKGSDVITTVVEVRRYFRGGSLVYSYLTIIYPVFKSELSATPLL